MDKQYDSFKANHMYFDPHNEPRLPLGDWNLPSALAPGDAPAGGPVASDSRNAPASSDAAWDPPKFDEPRTIPGGWDVSSLR